MITYCDASFGDLFLYMYEAAMIQWLLKTNEKGKPLISRSVIYMMSFHWVVRNVLIASVL